MLNPYYFIDRALNLEFNITLDSQHINHTKSTINIKPTFSQFGNYYQFINKMNGRERNRY